MKLNANFKKSVPGVTSMGLPLEIKLFGSLDLTNLAAGKISVYMCVYTLEVAISIRLTPY